MTVGTTAVTTTVSLSFVMAASRSMVKVRLFRLTALRRELAEEVRQRGRCLLVRDLSLRRRAALNVKQNQRISANRISNKNVENKNVLRHQ
jgi:hypothetical protein